MLFGSGKAQGAQSGQPQNTGGYIFDVTTQDFEDKVLRASMETPVIVDFWAPWCGPCKQLGPILEKAVTEAGGKVLMAKVNVDENQELAAAMRIQSIPVVYAFFQGRPLDGFQGAMPESQIKAFVEKVVQAARQGAPDALDIPAALNAATQALGHGDLQTAQTIYMQVLQEQEKNAQAYAGLVRTLIAGGALDRAAQMIESAPEEIAKDIHFTQAKTALELAQASPPGAVEELAARVAAKPEDHQARFDLAAAQFAAGQKEAAIDSLLEIISRNRTWKEDEARKQLLKLFDALGPADPLTAAGRRKLSSILFS